MNRNVVKSSHVQQMMTGNPNWWNINTMMRPLTQQPSAPFFFPQYMLPTTSSPPSSSSSSSSSSSLPMPYWHEIQELPHEPWSQLLMGGQLATEEEKGSMKPFEPKKFENSWEDQMMHQISNASIVDVKQENCPSAYGYGHASEEFQARPNWSHIAPAVSSPQSCVTNFSNNMLDFSTKADRRRHLLPEQSFECNSTPTGGPTKKAKVQPTSQTTIKVRKEKLGDRITALHQLVSPFGKTDTASVLLEAIGYVRFLQSQIEALSLPYLSNGLGNMTHQQSVQGERNCIFPEDPTQLLHDNSLKGKGVSEQDGQEEPKKDLRSRGLCLVPISCTMQVGSDNGADYWAPAALGGGFQ